MKKKKKKKKKIKLENPKRTQQIDRKTSRKTNNNTVTASAKIHAVLYMFYALFDAYTKVTIK